MKVHTFDSIKKYLLIGFFIFIIIIFFSLLIATRDSKQMKNLKSFIEADTKVLYISNKKDYSKYPESLFKKYDVPYLYINSEDLKIFEKSKLERIINSKYLNNIVVIFKDGKVVDAIIDYDDKELLNGFLQKYDIIPSILESTIGILEDAKKTLDADYTLVYIPYVYTEETDKQASVLSEISSMYEIDFKKIDAYLLSKFQQLDLNGIYQISNVEDQIVILIKDKTILGSIRGINEKSVYIDKLYNDGIINKLEDNINNISIDEFYNILNSPNKSIIIIGKDDCKYCKEVKQILNQLILNYNISVSYINIENIDSELSKKIESKLIELGYVDGITTPMTIISESNKLLDYVIGASSKEYFIDIFSENGIIK